MKFYSSCMSSVSVLFFSLFLGSFVSAQTFQISAYYSPIPNQNAYVSGSYDNDLKMNGNGTHGADGTTVYVGMISAPSKYDFGTKIFIPGLGVGTVHDRGGAIYAAKGYDRLDIWMGYGDEGRKRALQWGRQIVDGKIVSVNAKEGFIFDEKVLSLEDLGGFEVDVENDNLFNTNLWFKINNSAKNIDLNFISEEVKKIQKFLNIEQTGFYGYKTSKAVYAFQVKNNILKYKNDTGAGTWGPKTREIANKLVNISTSEAKRK